MVSSFSKRFLLALLAVVNLLVLFHYGLGALDLLKLVVTIIIATFIPGALVLSALKLYPDTFYRFILAFIIGIALDILIFILFSILDLRILIYFLLGITLLVYLGMAQPKKDWHLLTSSLQALPVTYWVVLSFLSLLVLGLIVMFFYGPNQLPGAQAVVYHVDYPWHLGNIAEVLHHWYPQDPRLAGQAFHYHIFFYIYMAMLAFVSKVSLPLIYFRFYIIFFLYLLIGEAYFLASRWFQKRPAGVVHVIITLFLGTALLAWPHNVFLRNFFISPTFLLALLILFPLLLEISNGFKTFKMRQLVVILLLVFAVSGAKGNFFPVIWAALLATVVYALLFKRRALPVVVIALSSLVVFSAVFILIFKGTGSEGINIIPLEIVTTTALYQYLQSRLAAMNPLCLPLLAAPLYLLLFYSFRLPALFSGLKNMLHQRREIELQQVFLLAVILAGCIPAYLLSYRGTSQYYFLFVGWAALNLLTAGYLIELFTSKGQRILKIFMLILLLLSAGDTIVTLQYQAYSNQKHLSLRNKPVTPAIYQGLSYLRTESPPDAVIASYRSFWLNKDNPRFYYYSAFAERRMLVEGWMYMRPEYQDIGQQRYADMQILFYTRNQNVARDIIRRYGIDYILVDRSHKQKLRFKWESILQKVYGNEEIELYKYLDSDSNVKTDS